MSVAANEGLEGLCAHGDSLPSKGAMRRKTRLRDELFQDLMKVCFSASISQLRRVECHCDLEHGSGLSRTASMDCGFYIGCYLWLLP